MVPINSTRISFVLFVVLYRGLLDIAYCFLISPHSHKGFLLEPGPSWIIALSYLLVIATASVIPVKPVSPSKFMLAFLYLVSYVPTTLLMALGGFPISPVLWFSLVFAFLSYLFTKQLNIKLNYSLEKGEQFLFPVIFGFSIIIFLVLVSQYGFKLPPSLFGVTETRAVYKESLREASPLIGYLVMWQGGVIAPFMVTWALTNRKIVVLLIALLIQLTIYSITGLKSQLFAIFFVIWILIGVRFYRERLAHYGAFSLVILVLGVVLIDCIRIVEGLDFVRKSHVPIMDIMFVRRLFISPALLFYYYYDFFSQNPHTYLSQSTGFRWLVEYPYDLPIPNLIGDVYFSSPRTHANANMWADAYASFGVVGMFIFAVLFRLLTSIIDSVSKGKNIYFVYALIVMPLFSLTNTGLLTTILTHGMLLAIVILILLPKSHKITH